MYHFSPKKTLVIAIQQIQIDPFCLFLRVYLVLVPGYVHGTIGYQVPVPGTVLIVFLVVLLASILVYVIDILRFLNICPLHYRQPDTTAKVTVLNFRLAQES